MRKIFLTILIGATIIFTGCAEGNKSLNEEVTTPTVVETEPKKEEIKEVKTKELALGEEFLVETEIGNYKITINGTRREDWTEQAEGKVILLDYSYENIDFGDSENGLLIDGEALKVVDPEGYKINPKGTFIGDSCSMSPEIIFENNKFKANLPYVDNGQEYLVVSFSRDNVNKLFECKVPIE